MFYVVRKTIVAIFIIKPINFAVMDVLKKSKEKLFFFSVDPSITLLIR